MIDYLALAWSREDEEVLEPSEELLKLDRSTPSLGRTLTSLTKATAVNARSPDETDESLGEKRERRRSVGSEERTTGYTTEEEEETAFSRMEKRFGAFLERATVQNALEREEKYGFPGAERRTNGLQALTRAGDVVFRTVETLRNIRETGTEALLRQMQQSERGSTLLSNRGRISESGILTEREESTDAWTVSRLDRVVERDARRYGGGFSLL